MLKVTAVVDLAYCAQVRGRQPVDGLIETAK